MICKSGKILDINTNEPLFESCALEESGYNEELYVTLLRLDRDNNTVYDKLRMSKLMLEIYYNKINLPFYFIDGNFMNCGCNNLRYITDKNNIENIETDRFILAEQEFRKINIGDDSTLYISEHGVIYDSYTNKVRPIYLARDSYKRISLYINGSPRKFSISRLVYMVFNNDYSLTKNDAIHHKDTNIWNNHYTNLEKTNNSDNVARSFIEESGNQRFELKFPIEIVREIKEKMSNGILSDQLAKEYDISHFKNMDEFSKYCTRLRSNRDFKHQLGTDYEFTKYREAAKNKRLILSTEDLHFICKSLQENKTYKTIYTELGNGEITYVQLHSLIKRILNRSDHQDIISAYDFSNYNPNMNRIKYHLTNEQKEEMKKLHAEGVTHSKIAEMYGVSSKYSSELCLGRKQF
jgi:hypothetical protein